MQKRLFAIFLAFMAFAAHAQTPVKLFDLHINFSMTDPSNEGEAYIPLPLDGGPCVLLLVNPSYLTRSQPDSYCARVGAGLAYNAGVLTATGMTTTSLPWTSITAKPSTLAGYGINDAVSASALAGYVTTSDPRLTNARAPLAHTHAISDVTGLSSALSAKLDTPTGTAAQYVRGDGSLANLPFVTSSFNFSLPAARTIAASTSYQAADPSKAAVLYPSYACQNATTVLAASGCTVQVRMGSGTLTCSTGTVYYTQSLTVGLGLLLTQNSTNPVPIFLPAGASFIICPQVGTFTISAVEQAAG